MNKTIFSILFILMAFPATAQENMTFGHQNPQQNETYTIIRGAGNAKTVIRQRKCTPPQNLINKSIDDINGMRFNHPVRIIHPNDLVTMDFNPDRLNIVVDHREIIRELRCG